MTPLAIVFMFIMVWWVVIFTALPWGNAPVDTPEKGHEGGAPANPRLKQKLIWTTIISLILTCFLVILVHVTRFSLHDWVKQWAESQISK